MLMDDEECGAFCATRSTRRKPAPMYNNNMLLLYVNRFSLVNFCFHLKCKVEDQFSWKTAGPEGKIQYEGMSVNVVIKNGDSYPCT
jgi:hypothetical protein